MKLSIYRWSHLVLAVASLIFILIAALTGAILSFDPLSHKNTASFNAQTPIHISIDSMRSQYLEVFKMEQNNYGEWIAEIMTEDGENALILVDPTTGVNLGKPIEQSDFFKDITGLHRSLFMGTLGRWLMAIMAIALSLLTISGLFLVAQKLGGWMKFFSRLKKDDPSPYYHTLIGRYSFLLILLISLSGAILFLDDIWKNSADLPELETYLENVDPDYEEKELKELPVFQQPLSDVKRIEFPLSDDIEDAFLVETIDKIQVINQYTGEVHDQILKEGYNQTEELLFSLHTGQNMGSIWPLLLLFGCLSILYFIYSGLSISIKRWKSKFKNKVSTKDAEIVLFIGSENGSTWSFAKAFHDKMLEEGYKIHTTGMDSTATFPNVKEILIFTSTYGTGEAPANARTFKARRHAHFTENVNYSVVGFGSKQYADFCKYAVDLDEELCKTPSKQITPIHTVDNKNIQQFIAWVNNYQKAKELKKFEVVFKVRNPKIYNFKVLFNSFNANQSDYFVLQLESNQRYKSGDLLSILPPNTPFARQYSIAKADKKVITLYVRKHNMGVCSRFLSSVKAGETLNGWIDENQQFHYNPSQPAFCIGNGTGLAPFIGFVGEKKDQPLHVIWGTKTKAERDFLLSHIPLNISDFTICYSQEPGVQKLYASTYFIQSLPAYFDQIVNGANVYICGAVKMDKDLKNALSDYATEKGIDPQIILERVKSDCY